MTSLKVILFLVIIAACIIEQSEARPRALHEGNHIMKRQRNVENKISGNKTARHNKRHNKARRHNKRHKNRNLLKSLIEILEDDYNNQTEDYDYESPIIEIRFKRDAAETESLIMNSLLRN